MSRPAKLGPFQRFLCALALAVITLPARSSGAQDLQPELLKRFGLRIDAGAAFFLSRDQLDWLGFKRPGILANLSFRMGSRRECAPPLPTRRSPPVPRPPKLGQ